MDKVNSTLPVARTQSCATAARGRRRNKRGFTLIEALIALIMFGIIMSALSFMFAALTKAQTSSESHQTDNGTVRVIFDDIKRDIQGGYASANDPASVFIGGGGSSSGGGGGSGTSQNTVSSPGLLTLSTCSYRIQADELNSTDSSNAASSLPGQQTSSIPQSGMQIVRYDLDTGSSQLSRSVVTVPNLQLVQPTTPNDPSTTIGTGIVSITFQFWDPTQSTWRDSWDYEQSVQAAAAAATTGTGASTGAAGATGSAATGADQTAATNTTNGDTAFPTAVQVTLVRVDSSGRQATYMTSFPVVAGQPFVDPSKQKNAAPTTGGAAAGSP